MAKKFPLASRANGKKEVKNRVKRGKRKKRRGGRKERTNAEKPLHRGDC